MNESPKIFMKELFPEEFSGEIWAEVFDRIIGGISEAILNRTAVEISAIILNESLEESLEKFQGFF